MSLVERVNALTRAIAVDQIAQDIDINNKFATKEEVQQISNQLQDISKQMEELIQRVASIERAGYITKNDLSKTADFVDG